MVVIVGGKESGEEEIEREFLRSGENLLGIVVRDCECQWCGGYRWPEWSS